MLNLTLAGPRVTRYEKVESLAKTEVLLMDDWGLALFTAENRHDLLEVLEDRHGVRSTVGTSQLPVDKWHDVVGDPTLADAILDRLVHNACKTGAERKTRCEREADRRFEQGIGTHDAVPRRFAPTGDRFASEHLIDLRRNRLIGLPPERVIGFTGMRSGEWNGRIAE